jgi:hypothetical protein
MASRDIHIGLYFHFLFLFLEDRATWCSRIIFIGRVARTWAKIHHPFTTCSLFMFK